MIELGQSITYKMKRSVTKVLEFPMDSPASARDLLLGWGVCATRSETRSSLAPRRMCPGSETTLQAPPIIMDCFCFKDSQCGFGLPSARREAVRQLGYAGSLSPSSFEAPAASVKRSVSGSSWNIDCVVDEFDI